MAERKFWNEKKRETEHEPINKRMKKEITNE